MQTKDHILQTIAEELFTRLEALDIGRFDVHAAANVDRCRQLCHDLLHLSKQINPENGGQDGLRGGESQVSSPNFARQTPVRKPKILVVDDDEDVHRITRFALRNAGMEVVSERNPVVALQSLLELRPDVIMLDLMMPEMNGFEFLVRLGKIQNRNKFRVLVASSRSYDKDRIAALEAGADDFLAKPFQVAELLLRLRRLAAA